MSFFGRLVFKLLCICLTYLILSSPVSAKLNATYEQNIVQWGQPTEIKRFPSKVGFTGYVTYSIDSNWKLKAFIVNNKVRREHLIPKDGKDPMLTRNEVREWAKKMFLIAHRGTYRRKITYPRVDGYFFNKGLIAYEHRLVGKKSIGYKAVKVLLYENNMPYYKVNPKAYL